VSPDPRIITALPIPLADRVIVSVSMNESGAVIYL
jgi:hypothetical protein